MGRRHSLFAAFAAAAALAWSVVACALPAGADEIAPDSAATAVLLRLSSDPRTPDAYSAAVDLHVKLHTFPFVGLAVHGTSSFRRPGFYHFQLDNLPKVAAKFDDLNYDLGDPTSWPQRFDVSFAPQSTDDAPVLRLIPKKRGLVRTLDIVTDAKGARILKATWSRYDGGTIVLEQTYATFGTADIVTGQHATIDIPHVRAEVSAGYTNVALDAPTFATLP
jgi:hypothetical protein